MRKILFLILFMAVNIVELWSQEMTISGRIYSADDNEPLPGVTVVIKGTSQGGITDFDGNFNIQAKPTDELEISFIGFETQIIQLAGRTSLIIKMNPSAESIDEVMVVGFGVQKKESVVGAISQVKGDDLVQSGVSNVSSALSGKLAGVVTIQNNGMPGEDNPEILIRGKSSWVSSSPLVMVDGIEREFTDINPNDIESMSVLKDASATAIYGTKGANGVILITTKRGKENKPSINVSVNQGFKFPTKGQEYYNAYETLQHANVAMKNDNNWDGLYSQEELEHYRLQDLPYKYPSVDWYNEMIKDVGYVTDLNFNVSGGTKKVKYFGSLSYLHDGDIINTEKNGDYDPRFYYDRVNIRTNLDFQLTKTTRLSSNIGGSYQLQNKPTADQFNLWNSILVGSVNMAPLYYGEDATLLYPDPYDPYSGIRPSLADSRQNPYTMIHYGSPLENGGAKGGYQKQNEVRVSTDLVLSQELDFIAKGLVFQGTVSYNSRMSYRKVYEQTVPLYRLNEDNSWTRFPSYEQDLSPISFRSEGLNGNERRLYYEARLNYSRNFGPHSLTAMGVFNRTQRNIDAYQPFKSEAWAGRATYDYSSKYLAEINIGYTGSDQFAPANRFGFFPAFAVGWNIAQEKFVKSNIPFLNTFKVRYSYGKAGNDNSSVTSQNNRWLYYSSWSQVDRYNDENQGLRHVLFGNDNSAIWTTPYSYIEGAVPNTTAQWEIATKNNLGVEVGVLENSLKLSVDLFSEQREKILMQPITVPDWVSGTFKDLNIGETKNHGMEVEVSYNKAFDNGLIMTMSGNFSFSENRIIKQDNPENMADYLKTEGKPIGVHYGYLTTSDFYQSVDDINNYTRIDGANYLIEGDIKYVDYNGDGKVDASDRVPIGNTDYPLINSALTTSLGYKGFSLTVMLQAVSEKSSLHVHNASYLFALNSNRILGDQLDYYTIGNTNASNPAPHYSDAIRQTNNQFDQYRGTTQTSWVDTDFFRVRQAELAYTFTGDRLNNIGINNLRLYISGNNLFTKSKIEFGDPEKKSIDAGAANSYPLIKRFNIGLKLNL